LKTRILLIGHGSRAKTGNQEVYDFATQWMIQHPDWDIQLCFIEYAEVLLEAGLEKAAQGADLVVAVPLILNAAGHVKVEVPAALEKARTQWPKVSFIYAKHLGATQEILAILQRRLKHVMHQLKHPDPKTTGVILLGRGSSDMVANGEVAKLARWLFESAEHDLVEIAFTGITYPRLETSVQRQVKLGMMQLVVLPYYLFDGRLISRIKEQMEQLKSQYPQIRFGLGEYIGFEDEIYQLMSRRVLDCLDPNQRESMMECDGCLYKTETLSHTHSSPAAHCTHAHSENEK